MPTPHAKHDPDWATFASCKSKPPSVFFFEDTAPNHEARHTCIDCPVRIDCLEYAVPNEKDWGVWAGLTARVRLTLRRLMLRHNAESVTELLATNPQAVLSLYPAPKRAYKRNPDKLSPISTHAMFQSLIHAAKIRHKAESIEKLREQRSD